VTVAVDAVLQAVGPSAAPVEVVGEGPLARALQERLAGRLATSDARPAVVVETTGSGEAVAQALSSVADLGLVVLAGPSAEGGGALDFYEDLHVRGLTLVGIPEADPGRGAGTPGGA
jgi:threonine dehydrogenase-like Zn-dependent dehydrogenase